MIAYASESTSVIQAWAQINNQTAPFVPLETFDITLAAYGSVGHFSCTTAISALASHGWASPNNLRHMIESAQPSFSDGSPSYPIKLYAVGAYDGLQHIVFAGDIDELSWDFDRDELKITGRDYGGRMRDWKAIITPKWINMDYAAFASQIISQVGLTPQFASQATSKQLGQNLGQILYGIDNEAGSIERVNFGFTHSGFSYETSVFSQAENMWELLNLVSRAIGFIVTVHFDKTVYVGPPGADPQVNVTPRVFTWFATEGTPNVTPVRHLNITHGPRQYGTFSVRGFSYHSPSVQLASTSLVGIPPSNSYKNPQKAVLLARQPLSAGIYKTENIAANIEAGKPNYFFYFNGATSPQIERDMLAEAFNIARHLYIVEGEIDGDPTLVPTTKLTLDVRPPGDLQGYSGSSMPLDIASVDHHFDMSGGDGGGFLTTFKAWYAPPINTPLPNQVGPAVQTS